MFKSVVVSALCFGVSYVCDQFGQRQTVLHQDIEEDVLNGTWHCSVRGLGAAAGPSWIKR